MSPRRLKAELPVLDKEHGETNPMTDFSGSASSKVQSQTVVGVPGQDDRQLAMAVLAGVHTTSDQKFDKAKIIYVGTAETVNGDGEQRGYFHNVHPNGDTSHGTFEAKGKDDWHRRDARWQMAVCRRHRQYVRP